MFVFRPDILCHYRTRKNGDVSSVRRQGGHMAEAAGQVVLTRAPHAWSIN